ncbi:probable nuclear transport factor 2 isoform X1 [Neodiprion virginianus]|uniref:probable nuclear transport factor 2 isoform X1 n=1 Tax=Neodiprion fabricii TaxID=2872261 RepID=UPI001ED8D006|nr:probable nuclear transport factor 2 isoform X1 [Neodiprion fabricii]XP_046621587.1 probable nuclear transport factor 2 isoform X1 [Neodiprion virginianus]
MALNPSYEAIGKGFVQQYYALFDDPVQRPNLINMYNTESSFMTFEGLQIQGAIKIMEKLTSLSFQKINRIITAIDSQPMFDGGVLINVLGRLQADEDPPHAFSQIFVLKPLGNSFFCQHDIFRLGIHDTILNWVLFQNKYTNI